MEKVEVIFEDEMLLVINKPAGMTVTQEGVKVGETLEDWLNQNYLNSKFLKRSGIVHRLDKGTSGLMIVAKTEDALADLQRQFKERRVVKQYLALVSGQVSRKGEINAPIGRHQMFSKWRVKPEGKMALTQFKLIKLLKYENKIYSLIEINLKTGRTHQVRVHFSYLGWPLVGDKTYGGDMTLGLNRPFLQSSRIEFELPFTDVKKYFEVALAEELTILVGKMNETV